MEKKKDFINFNIFNFISVFVKELIEIFVSLYLFKNGFSIRSVVLFYVMANIFAIPISYIYVVIGEKTKYSHIMLFGYISFIIFELLLRNLIISDLYIVLLAFIYSLYRRGYWISRRFYITNIIPEKKSSSIYSIVMVLIQVAKILSGYVGAFFLSNASITDLTILSVILLTISLVFLSKIKYKNKPTKIELLKNLKKYPKDNLICFSIYELNNLLDYLFPIYVALYINKSYQIAGNLNAISMIAIIIFILVYGRIINEKRNYFILSTILAIICIFLKINITSYIIMIVYFINGLIVKMQNQSTNKIYFENNNGMDITHYNLIYQIVECFVRGTVAFILLFMSNIKTMILTVNIIIIILLSVYIYIKNVKKYNKKYK